MYYFLLGILIVISFSQNLSAGKSGSSQATGQSSTGEKNDNKNASANNKQRRKLHQRDESGKNITIEVPKRDKTRREARTRGSRGYQEEKSTENNEHTEESDNPS